jgi:chromosome segregation ATPase
MSDNSVFINAYLDNAIGTIHEQISNILTLKTQLKVSQSILAEKDNIIQNISNDVNNLQTIISNKDKQLAEAQESSSAKKDELSEAVSNASAWEQSYNSMAAKVSHMDTLLKQITEMKNIIIEKDKQIENLNKEIIELTAKETIKKKVAMPKKEINIVSSQKLEESNNDF